MQIDALIADNGMRKRDGRFADQDKYKAKPHPLHDKRPVKPEATFGPRDFHYDPATQICICPAGQPLYSNGSQCTTNGRTHHKFQGAKRVCGPCALRTQCLRHPDRTPTRQVAFLTKNQASPLQHTEQMKQRIDSDHGRARYGRRFATVEPVFGNLRHNGPRPPRKQLNRFTLRGKAKVDGQWKLYCLVHNIGKRGLSTVIELAGSERQYGVHLG